MKQIEVNTHSDRVEIECEIGDIVISKLIQLKHYRASDLLTDEFDDNEENLVYTTLGQFIFNDIVDVISNYIKVKEDEIEYDLDDDYVEYTKEEFIEMRKRDFVFVDDSYILPDGSQLECLDVNYIESLKFDKIKHYLK